jgi:sugar (pentulose or hexulose) kinase
MKYAKGNSQTTAQSLEIGRHAIGIDIGTSTLCFALFDIDSLSMISVKTVDNTALINHRDPRAHEQNPCKIWEIIDQLFLQCEEDLSLVKIIAITGQMHGAVLLDSENNPVSNLLTWRDARYPVDDNSQEFSKMNGCALHVGYGANSIRGMLKTQGGSSIGQRICSIESYIMGKLCGDYSVDESMAASFGCFDITNRCWNLEQIEQMGLSASLFHDVFPSCVPVSKIMPVNCKRYGLSSDATVFSPIGDNQASVIGATGFLNIGVVNIGTSGQISVPCSSIIYSKSIEVRPLIENMFLQVYSSLCGGWSYAYLKDFCKDILGKFGFALSDGQIYTVLDSLVVDSSDSEGLIVDTRFLGTRENPLLRGEIREIDTRNLNIKNLAFGFIQGIVRELHPPAIQLHKFSFIAASGNSVRKSPIMKRAIEQEFGCACMEPPFLEEASVGAILGCLANLEGKERIKAFYQKHFNGNIE